MGTETFPVKQDPYLVFARKYRPRLFDEVVGQSHITQTLKNALLAGKVGHAFLFSGTRGVGKTTVARILAKALNCEKGTAAEPCNMCSLCLAVSDGHALDVLEIDGASHRGIGEIKEIIENLRYQPIHARFRIAIIDEVHQLTDAAFNALLKTLEEPPPHVKFIFATTDINKVPDTIRSRCQCFVFRRIKQSEISVLLGRIAKQEGMGLTEGALEILARSADGSLRDAQSLLDQVRAWMGDRVDEAMVRELLGAIDPASLQSICEAAISEKAGEALRLANAVLQEGVDVLGLINGLVEQFRSLLIAAVMPDPTTVLEVSAEKAKLLQERARNAPPEAWHECLKIMLDVDQAARRSVNPKVVLEMGLVRISTLPRWAPVEELIARIGAMENRLAKRGNSADARDTTFDVLPSPRADVSQASDGKQVESESTEAVDRWRAFVSFVQKEKGFLGDRLKHAQLLAMRDGYIAIGESPGHFLEYLQDSDTFGFLETSAKRFFAKNVKLVVKPVPELKKWANTTVMESTMEASGQNEVVEEALRVFGGTVRQDKGASS